MNSARLKWVVLLAACFLTSYGLSHYRDNTLREYVTSAQVYWHVDQPSTGASNVSPAKSPQAIITLTTAAEVRSETLVGKGLRIVGGWLKLKGAAPDLHIGAAHVFTLQNGNWEEQKLSPMRSPLAFPLWPYNGSFYTWDSRQAVFEWNGHLLLAVLPQRASELHHAFPLDPNNYLAANAGVAKNPYDVVQDVITRDEWHAYQNIAALPDGKRLPFPVGDKTFEIVVRRGRGSIIASEVSLSVGGAGKSLALWQAQPVAQSVSAQEIARYFSAPPLYPGSASTPLQRVWSNLGSALLTLLVTLLIIWALFLKPMLYSAAPATVQYADANEYDYPRLDRERWDEYTTKIEALGFERVRDVKLANTLVGGIARIFLHPKSACYASVHQVFSRNAPGLSFGFTSYLGEDWSVGHGVTKPLSGSAITRTGHKLSFSRPGMSLEDLYNEHLATRDKISNDLGLAVVTPQGFETYQERSDLEAQARRDLIAKTNPIAIALKVYWARIKPLSNDWLGDYPKEMEERTRQKITAVEPSVEG